jgi:hypothetical protein
MNESLKSQTTEQKDTLDRPIPLEYQNQQERRFFGLLPEFFKTQGDSSLVIPEQNEAHLNDYLKSSERLLQVLAEQEAVIEKNKNNWAKNLINPLRVTSVLMVMIANILLVSGLNNTGNVSTKLINEKTSTTVQIENSPEVATDNASNLGKNEFQTSSPRTATSQVTPSETFVENTTVVIPGAYSDLATALLPPSMRPYMTESYVVQPTAPQP